MFGRKARRIKELEQELSATRVARDYYAKRFVEVSNRLQGRDSKGRFLRKLGPVLNGAFTQGSDRDALDMS